MTDLSATPATPRTAGAPTSTADRGRRFAAFVTAHRDRAVRLAWRLTGEDRATAEEVVQDALLRAHGALPRFREEAALSTWFYRILVRQAANRRRWRGVRRLVGMDAAPEPAAPGPQGDPALRARIGRAVDRLPGGQREVFVLVHLEGFTVEETAALTGRAPGTVKSHLHRALASLRTDLAPLREEAP